MSDPEIDLGHLRLRVMGVAFLGLHVPLVVLVLYALATQFEGYMAVLLLALVATLVASAATLLMLYRLLDDMPDAAGKPS